MHTGALLSLGIPCVYLPRGSQCRGSNIGATRRAVRREQRPADHMPGLASGMSAYTDHQRDRERSFHPASCKNATLAHKALIRTLWPPEPVPSLRGRWLPRLRSQLQGRPALSSPGVSQARAPPHGPGGRGLRPTLSGRRKEGRTGRHSEGGEGQTRRQRPLGGDGGSSRGPAAARRHRQARGEGRGPGRRGWRAETHLPLQERCNQAKVLGVLHEPVGTEGRA